MKVDANDLCGRWNVRFDDGKAGWLQLEPRDQHGHLNGHMFIPNSVVDYPPNNKRTGRNYDNHVFLAAGETITLGTSAGTLYHRSNPSSGQGMFQCKLVADDVLYCTTRICEDMDKIMQYPGNGYPFQFMGSGNFTATR